MCFPEHGALFAALNERAVGPPINLYRYPTEPAALPGSFVCPESHPTHVTWSTSSGLIQSYGAVPSKKSPGHPALVVYGIVKGDRLLYATYYYYSIKNYPQPPPNLAISRVSLLCPFASLLLCVSSFPSLSSLARSLHLSVDHGSLERPDAFAYMLGTPSLEQSTG